MTQVLRTGPLAIKLLRHFESETLRAYKCPAGIWTIAKGLTFYPEGFRGGRAVRAGDVLTKAEAAECNAAILTETFEPGVRAALKGAPTSPAQFGAMVCLAWNIGVKAFAGSTVCLQHRLGNHDGAAKAFSAWNKAKNPKTGIREEMAGLTRRRAAEAALYRSDFAELARLTRGEVA